MDVAARLEVIETENEVLRARIAELESLLGHDWLPPVEWRLTPAEARVMGALRSRDVATKGALMAALYRDNAADEAEIKIVDVFVCKIRKKVKSFGIVIETRWGIGYSLTPESRALLA